jgi:hypothetical protein
MTLRFLLTLTLLIGNTVALWGAATVVVPAGIDHAPWTALLKRYVNDQGLVDYKAWSEHPRDIKALDHYIDQFASEAEFPATGNEEIASLINAYNAIIIKWILEHYPTPSIREIAKTWRGKRWTIGGTAVSLDDLEHLNLRPLISWKTHGVLVCGARSSSPLPKEAYTEETLDSQIDAAFKTWLARPDLNTFDPNDHLVNISKIFEWFREDFNESPQGVKGILARYAPEPYAAFLEAKQYIITFKDYNWGLNDQSNLGKDYKLSFFRLLFGSKKHRFAREV